MIQEFCNMVLSINSSSSELDKMVPTTFYSKNSELQQSLRMHPNQPTPNTSSGGVFIQKYQISYKISDRNNISWWLMCFTKIETDSLENRGTINWCCAGCSIFMRCTGGRCCESVYGRLPLILCAGCSVLCRMFFNSDVMHFDPHDSHSFLFSAL